MRQPYLKHITRVEAATPTYYTYDERVDPGKILVIRNLCASWSDMATTESAQFFIKTGQGNIFLRDDLPSVTGGKPRWSGQAFVGEGQQIGVYTPDSAASDVIYFDIVGELWDLKDWIAKGS